MCDRCKPKTRNEASLYDGVSMCDEVAPRCSLDCALTSGLESTASQSAVPQWRRLAPVTTAAVTRGSLSFTAAGSHPSAAATSCTVAPVTIPAV